MCASLVAASRESTAFISKTFCGALTRRRYNEAREFRWHRLFCLLAIVFWGGWSGIAGERQVLLANLPRAVTVLKSEFIFETAPFP